MALQSIISQDADLDNIIRHYFDQEMSNKEILQFCATHNNIHISLSTLKRHLQRMNLRRRITAGEQENQFTNLVSSVERATSDSGSVLGTPLYLDYNFIGPAQDGSHESSPVCRSVSVNHNTEFSYFPIFVFFIKSACGKYIS